MDNQQDKTVNREHPLTEGLVAAWTPDGKIDVPPEPLTDEERAQLARDPYRFWRQKGS